MYYMCHRPLSKKIGVVFIEIRHVEKGALDEILNKWRSLGDKNVKKKKKKKSLFGLSNGRPMCEGVSSFIQITKWEEPEQLKGIGTFKRPFEP